MQPCHDMLPQLLQFIIQMQAFVTTVHVLFFFNFDYKAEKMLI